MRFEPEDQSVGPDTLKTPFGDGVGEMRRMRHPDGDGS